LHHLHGGTLRFGQLQRLVPHVTQRVLTLQLRELERDGLITRTVYAEVPPRVEYDMTPPCKALMPILAALGDWLYQNDSALESLQREAPFQDEDEASTS
jgi:DNA-binding HxlR family transcriptional regulator